MESAGDRVFGLRELLSTHTDISFVYATECSLLIAVQRDFHPTLRYSAYEFLPWNLRDTSIDGEARREGSFTLRTG